MAQLRYQNTAVPNLASVAGIAQNATNNFSAGFDKLAATVNGLQAQRAQAASNAILPEIARVTGEGDVNGFLDSLKGRLDPRNITPELAAALGNLRGTAQGLDQGRANIGQTNANIGLTNANILQTGARTRGIDANTAGTQAQTQIALNADGRTQTAFDRGIAKQDALGNLTNTFADARVNAIRGEGDLGSLVARPEAQQITAGLVKRGLPQHVAEAFAIEIGEESGFDSGINEKNPLVKGSRGGFGLYQLTGDRRVAYEKYAQERGVDPSNEDAQLDYLVQELRTSEKGAASSILNSKNTAEAGELVVSKFLRPSQENQNKRIAKYRGGIDFSQGGVLTPNDINPLIDSTFGAFGTGQDRRSLDAQNSDANRTRDTAFNTQQENARIANAGLEAAITNARSGLNPVDTTQQIINDPTLSAQEKQSAIQQLEQLPVQAIQAPVPGSQPAVGSDTNASTSLNTFVESQQAALSSDNGVRITNNASKFYQDDSASTTLAERRPDINASPGELLDAINTVSRQAGVSKSVAAAVLEESTKRGTELFGLLDGDDIVLDTDAAIKLAKRELSPEGVRASAETRELANNNLAAAENIKNAIANQEALINRQETIGEDSTASRQLLADYRKQALDIAKNNPIAGGRRNTFNQTINQETSAVKVQAQEVLQSIPNLIQKVQSDLQNGGSARVTILIGEQLINELPNVPDNVKKAAIAELKRLPETIN